MATYIYFCEHHGEFEWDHSMSEKLELCPKCQEEGLEPKTVKRLISSKTVFSLIGNGWGRDNYS